MYKSNCHNAHTSKGKYLVSGPGLSPLIFITFPMMIY